MQRASVCACTIQMFLSLSSPIIRFGIFVNPSLRRNVVAGLCGSFIIGRQEIIRSVGRSVGDYQASRSWRYLTKEDEEEAWLAALAGLAKENVRHVVSTTQGVRSRVRTPIKQAAHEAAVSQRKLAGLDIVPLLGAPPYNWTHLRVVR